MVVVGLVLVVVPGKICNYALTKMQGYYKNRGTTTGCVNIHGRMITKCGYTETRYYSYGLVYLVYV